MKGATAEPDVKTTRLPSRTRQMTIGRSQNFFRSFIKDQSSIRNSPIIPPLVSSSREQRAVSGILLFYCLPLTAYVKTVLLDETPAEAVG